MKTILTASIIAVFWSCAVLAQNKKDSLKLKADIEAIRQGKPVKIQSKNPSILRRDSTPPVIIDTATIKADSPIPTPTLPNNPNPQDPRPSIVNPEPPATPPESPAVPQGTPRGPDNPPKKKDKSST